MKTLPIVLMTAFCAATALASLPAAQNKAPEPGAPRPIPEIEAARRAGSAPLRGDSGPLTADQVLQQRAPVTTHSSLFVIEGVTAKSIRLPITGDHARIGVFSLEDSNLNVRLTGPSGADVPVAAFGRSDAAEESAFSKVVSGRGDAADGVLMMSDTDQITPGAHTLTLERARGSVDVIVNDAGGPQMSLWLSENNVDSSRSTKLFARIAEGDRAVTGARLTAVVRGQKALRFTLVEIEPGLYATTIKPTSLSGISTLVVEAKGKTAAGLDLLRHGNIELITGASNARLVGVKGESLTETDLAVDVTVEVSAAGRYYMRGNLLSATGEPVVWAQDARDLTPGRHTLTLRFDRNVIGQSGLRTGFVLSDLILMNTSEMPGIMAGRLASPVTLESEL